MILGVSLTSILIGAAAVAVVFGVASAFGGTPKEEAEERLTDMTGGREAKTKSEAVTSLLKPANLEPGWVAKWASVLPDADKINLLCEQAAVRPRRQQVRHALLRLGRDGGFLALALKLPLYVVPIGAAMLGSLPFLWLRRRKAARTQAFLAKMPEAVELMSRAMRAGHGLASGLSLVAEEMKGPIAEEFRRVFEEQNLGIPLDVALRDLSDRVPAMDVRFLVTAIVIQRGTGGDLAEVLDKIGRLIRQRFELIGHVKALTSEGRLSGVVLLALPPALLGFLAVSNWPLHPRAVRHARWAPR